MFGLQQLLHVSCSSLCMLNRGGNGVSRADYQSECRDS